MTSSHSTDSPDRAAAVLRAFSAVPANEQDEAELMRPGRECSTALPDQGIPGYAASVRAATWLQRLYFVCILLAAGWAVISFFAGDPDRDPLLLPPEVVFLPTDEILLLAPIALVAVYAPAHLAVLWKVRTSTRAVLRWATEDRWSSTRGIPAQSPFVEIMAGWESLKARAGLVLMMDGFVTVFLYLARQDEQSYGLFLAPVVSALPILATYLFSSARARLAQRRHLLVADRLFRVPADEEPPCRTPWSSRDWSTSRRARTTPRRRAATGRSRTSRRRSARRRSARTPSGGRASQPARPRRTISSIQSGANGEVQFGGVG